MYTKSFFDFQTISCIFETSKTDPKNNTMGKVIYGHVETISDIGRINKEIRGNVANAKTRNRLSKLMKRSAYLLTLSNTPAWKKKFRGKLRPLRKEIRQEYTKTAKSANARAKYIKTTPDYDTILN